MRDLMMNLRATLNSVAVLALLLVCGRGLASAQNYFPVNDARDVNPDVQLKLTFSQPPHIGPSGRVRVFEADSDRLIDTLDLSVPAGPTERATGAALTA